MTCWFYGENFYYQDNKGLGQIPRETAVFNFGVFQDPTG